jgi:deoxycytidine triphosphate deaminase/NTP pyrophosphatase (non-canonical NTP hydrolase)
VYQAWSEQKSLGVALMNTTKTLADHEIAAAIARGELVLDAIPGGCAGACYELRMGNVYYDLTEDKRHTVGPGGDVLVKPGHRVVLITHEQLKLKPEVFARIISKGSLFSVGLSPVATYADPGFHGRIGIVTQNISDKYIVLPLLEPIAKADFTVLETAAAHPYRGQHGFETQIWPIKHHLQKTREQLSGDPRMGPSTPDEQGTSEKKEETLASLTRLQIAADRKHGFPVELPSEKERCNQISRDLVGLMGEVGEFADALKKVDLTFTRPGYRGDTFAEAEPKLRMELADIQIYLLRLAHLTGADLAEVVLEKMRINGERYAYLAKQ